MTFEQIIEKLTGELKASRGVGFEFRTHQIDAIKKYLENHYGLYNITCGVGKTLIQACIAYLEVLRCKEKGIPFTGMFVCHRLMLEDQVKFEYTNFFGDFFKEQKVEFRVLNTTGDNSLENVARNNMAMPMGENVLYFTTTASLNDYVKNHTNKHKDGYDEIKEHIFKNLSVYIHDEAHKESCDLMVKSVLSAMSGDDQRAFWFTATPGEYLNINLPVISSCSFATAVESNYIVKPVLFTIKAPDFEHMDINAEANAVISAFKHLRRNKKDEVPSLITFHDAVDSVRSVGDVINQYKTQHPRFKANVYEIVSDKTIIDEHGGKVWVAGIRLNGSKYSDGKLYTKAGILDVLRNDHEPKIIMNAFMLTEGIDLPEINGVLLLCQKSDASLYQAISRGCRKTPGKINFNLYVTSEDSINVRVEDFLAELVKFTDGKFDFGGTIEDVNNGSTEEDDTEDYENSGIELPETMMYKNVKISINKKRTEFDKMKVRMAQVADFNSKIKVASIIKTFQLIQEYSVIWKDEPELKETYLNQKKIFSYLPSFA